MRYFIITYGCQMNKSDSEKIAFLLQKQGYEAAKNEGEADLILINVCSVRQSAVDRVYAKVNKYFKKKRVILTGCILETDKKELKNKAVEFWHPDSYFNCSAEYQLKFSAFLPIMTGCNNFCAYCVVPYTRGREKSRKTKDILKEAKSLIKKNYKEIILLGQNVNSYYDGKINFSSLLKKINDILGDFWLSFLTSHPKDMSNELIETIAKCKKISPYVHLPVQSGDDEILRAMKRDYTISHYKNLIKKIRLAFKKHRPAFPSVAISTDVILGFPGETKEQFENTVKLFKDYNPPTTSEVPAEGRKVEGGSESHSSLRSEWAPIKFDMAYIAKYSPRPGTAAAKLKDDIPQKEKERRWKLLTRILKKTALEKNKKYVGKEVEVLVEKAKNGFLFGKTRTYKTVKIHSSDFRVQSSNLVGQFVKVKIKKALPWGLKGQIKKGRFSKSEESWGAKWQKWVKWYGARGTTQRGREPTIKCQRSIVNL